MVMIPKPLPPHQQKKPDKFLSTVGKWIVIIFLLGGVWVMLRGEPLVLTTSPPMGAGRF